MYDIGGRLDDLIGVPILKASEDTNNETYPDDRKLKDYYVDHFTWTFYNIAISKGYVTIRWLGESNGCYAECVDLKHTALKSFNLKNFHIVCHILSMRRTQNYLGLL